MPKVLTANATITCPHGGVGTSIPVPPRLATVNGGEILLDGDQGTLSCAFTVPCVGYALRSMGLNAAAIQGRMPTEPQEQARKDTPQRGQWRW